MIFAVRALMVSLAFFALLYTFLSLGLSLAWKCVGSRLCKYLAANGLLMFRVAPFARASPTRPQVYPSDTNEVGPSRLRTVPRRRRTRALFHVKLIAGPLPAWLARLPNRHR